MSQGSPRVSPGAPLGSARSITLAALTLLFASSATLDAGTIVVGYLSFDAESPSAGLNTVSINNLTGSSLGCGLFDSSFAVCDLLTFTGTLTSIWETSDALIPFTDDPFSVDPGSLGIRTYYAPSQLYHVELTGSVGAGTYQRSGGTSFRTDGVIHTGQFVNGIALLSVAEEVPEPSSLLLCAGTLAALLSHRRVRATASVLGLAALAAVLAASAQTPVMLSAISPLTAQAGTMVRVTASGVPAVTASQVLVELTAAAGSPVVVPATEIATVLGSTRRIGFPVPPSLTQLDPRQFQVRLKGTVIGSANFVTLTVNPPASLGLPTPSHCARGNACTLTVAGNYTNFRQGLTTVAVDGDGIAVLNVTISSLTRLTATLSVAPDATASERSLFVNTGGERLTLPRAFSVAPALPSPKAAPSGFSPNRDSIALFGYSRDNNWYFTQAFHKDRPTWEEELDSGRMEGGYQTFASYRTGGSTYLLSMSQSGAWVVQELLDNGMRGRRVSHGKWDTGFDVLVPIMTHSDGGYLLCHYANNPSSGWSPNAWFIRQIYADGTFSGSDTARGTWAGRYKSMAAFYASSGFFVFGHNLDNGYYFTQKLITEGASHGQLVANEASHGTWSGRYDIIRAFPDPSVGASIFGYSTSTRTWFTQRLNYDGTVGAEMDHGTWCGRYPTIDVIATHGKVYIIGQRKAGIDYTCETIWGLFPTVGNFGNRHFIQEIKPNGIMDNNEIQSGDLNFFYDKFVAFPYEPTYSFHTRWMEADWATIRGQKLNDVALPAAHDAGMYQANACTRSSTKPYAGVDLGLAVGANPCNTQTQKKRIYDQLMAGARYLDLRPMLVGQNDPAPGATYMPGEFRIHHTDDAGGCVAGTVKEVIDDVRRFVSENRYELVVLDWSHFKEWPRDAYDQRRASFKNMSEGNRARFIAELRAGLDDVLIKERWGRSLTSLTMEQLLSLGNVLLLMQKPAASDPGRGLFAVGPPGSSPPPDVIAPGSYANTSGLEPMLIDQRCKTLDPLKRANCLNDASLFRADYNQQTYWTLTQNPVQVGACSLLETLPGTTLPATPLTPEMPVSLSSFLYPSGSILDLALQANSELAPILTAWNNDVLDRNRRLNVVFVDNFDRFNTLQLRWLQKRLWNTPRY